MKKLAISLLLLTSALIAVAGPTAAAVPTCRGFAATIVGTAGNDILTGTSGVDVIVGFGGRDEIYGYGGDDILCGGPGGDTIEGGSGEDQINGGSGVDTIKGQAGDDELRGGPGLDVIYGDYADGSGEGHDLIYGGSHKDKVFAGEGDDVVFGGSGPDEIYGQAGDDVLHGTAGDDTLVGGLGTDDALGGKGIDECSAESGKCEKFIPEFASHTVSNDDGDVMITTTVSHTEPVATVEVALKNGKLGMWVQLDGTLGPNKVWHEAALVSTAGTTTEWSAEITVPRGHYSMSARAIDDDGDKGRLRPRPFFNVSVTGFEFGVIVSGDLFNFRELRPLPEGTVLGRSPRDQWGNPVPAAGDGPTVRMSGAAYEGSSAMDFVDAAIQDTATNLWLQPDGSFAATMVRHSADCPHCPGTPTVFWLFDAELPDGHYALHVFGRNGGLVDVAEDTWAFTVDGSVAETPRVTVDQPDHTAFVDEPVVFTGDASDNIGVLRVTYSIRDRATGLWLCGFHRDEWTADKCAIWADLADPNKPATEWSFEPLDLDAGSYRLSVAVFDEVLHRDSIRPWMFFEVTD